jgi:hypothetical protein
MVMGQGCIDSVHRPQSVGRSKRIGYQPGHRKTREGSLEEPLCFWCNLSDLDRVALALQLKPMLDAQARARQGIIPVRPGACPPAAPAPSRSGRQPGLPALWRSGCAGRVRGARRTERSGVPVGRGRAASDAGPDAGGGGVTDPHRHLQGRGWALSR